MRFSASFSNVPSVHSRGITDMQYKIMTRESKKFTFRKTLSSTRFSRTHTPLVCSAIEVTRESSSTERKLLLRPQPLSPSRTGQAVLAEASRPIRKRVSPVPPRVLGARRVSSRTAPVEYRLCIWFFSNDVYLPNGQVACLLSVLPFTPYG